MPTKPRKSVSNTKVTSLSPVKTRIIFVALIVLFRSPGPVINVDQSTVIRQTFYYLQSKSEAEVSSMQNTDPETIQRIHCLINSDEGFRILERLLDTAEIPASGRPMKPNAHLEKTR